MTTETGLRGSSTEWPTWGTYVFLAVEEPHLLRAAIAVARPLLAAIDRACSRFRDDSDLVRANRSPGRWVRVDGLLAEATAAAVRAADLTDGLVTPCLGRAMVALGYDADLAVIRRRTVAPARRLPPPSPDAWREVGVEADAVRVPPGCELDLGATAKAWAADLVARAVADRIDSATLVGIGGDLRALGASRWWPVAVREQRQGVVDQVIELRDGGLATSSTVARRWRGARGSLHHLLDPRTNLPVRGDVRTATATGATCVAANVATTAALVLGDEAGTWLQARCISARLVHADGSVTSTGSWPVEGRAA